MVTALAVVTLTSVAAAENVLLNPISKRACSRGRSRSPRRRDSCTGTVGTSDILWQHTNGRLVLWYMDGLGNRTLLKPVSSAGDWQVLGPR